MTKMNLKCALAATLSVAAIPARGDSILSAPPHVFSDGSVGYPYGAGKLQLGSGITNGKVMIPAAQLAPGAVGASVFNATGLPGSRNGADRAADVYRLREIDPLACTTLNHDDAATLRAAVSYAAANSSGGAKIVLPHAACWLGSVAGSGAFPSAAFVLPNNVSLEGEGIGGTAIAPTVAMTDMVVVAGQLADVKGIQFANRSSLATNAIRVDKGSFGLNTYIVANYFSLFPGYGIHVESGFREVIDGNISISNGTFAAFNNDGVNMQFTNNFSQGGNGLLLTGNPQGVEGGIINNNVIFGNANNSNYALKVCSGLDLHFKGNTWESNGATAIFAPCNYGQTINGTKSFDNWYGVNLSASQAQGTGSVSGSTLTLTATTLGPFSPGDVLTFAGAPTGTVILGPLSGTTNASTTATAATTTNIIPVASASGIAIGQSVSGTGVPLNTTVVGISGLNVQVNPAVNVASGAALTFFTAGGAGTYALNQNVGTIASTTIYAYGAALQLRGTRGFISLADTIEGRGQVGIDAFSSGANPNSGLVLDKPTFYPAQVGAYDLFISYNYEGEIDTPNFSSSVQNILDGGGNLTTRVDHGMFTIAPIANSLTYGTQVYGVATFANGAFSIASGATNTTLTLPLTFSPAVSDISIVPANAAATTSPAFVTGCVPTGTNFNCTVQVAAPTSQANYAYKVNIAR